MATSDVLNRTGTATVLFTDLVGSTELRAALGEEHADALRRVHDALLTDAVTAEGGTVVKGLGDGIMATFAAAADAVAAAVTMQQRTDAHSRRDRSAPLAVRIGISAGDVSWDDDDCFGAPVVEAARLCATADGGQILAADVVRALARGRGGFSFRSVGELDLKGLPDPVAAYEVAWEPMAATGAVPLPPALVATHGFGFVGRGDQLADLAMRWTHATDGEPQVVLIAGEPGIGKTRLATELASIVHEHGATVLFGRCDEDLGVPFQPFVEALAHFVAHTEPDRLATLLGPHGGDLARLVPEVTERADLPAPLRSDPETERYRLFDAVAGWLVASSQEGGLVLVLDDIHWASKPSLLLLRHVIRASDTGRLLIVGTYRDTDLDRRHPLAEMLADLRRDERVTRLPLGGLDRVGVAALLAAAAGHDLDDTGLALAGALHRETEGNPFFVSEIIRHLAESGVVYERDGRWVSDADVADVAIPEGVREVVGRRLSRLSDDANRVLTVAAVVGREFDVALVDAVSGAGEDAVVAALDDAVDARLVEETGIDAYRFSHALVRSTLYDETSATRRARLHRKVATALEEHRAGDVGALAHHWAEAGAAGDLDKAIQYLGAAAAEAAARLAHDEAAALYGRALEILDDTESRDASTRIEVSIGLGEAQRHTGDDRYRATLLEAARLARAAGTAEQLARAAVTNYRGIWSIVGDADMERIAALEAALAALPREPSSLRAQVLGTLATEIVFSDQRDRRFELAEEALQIARDVGDKTALADALRAYVSATIVPSRLAEIRPLTAELCDVADALGDPGRQVLAHIWHAIHAMRAGAAEEAAHSVAIGASIARDLGEPMSLWVTTTNQATLAVFGGDLDAGERLAGQAFEVGQACGQPDALTWFAAQMWIIKWDQGRLDELVDALEAEVERSPALPAWRAVLAVSLCELDRAADARAHLEALVTDGNIKLPYDITWLAAASALAETAWRVRDAERGAVLRDALAPYPEQVSSTGVTLSGSTARYIGLAAAAAGDVDTAVAYLERAIEDNERLRAPVWAARSRIDLGEVLLERGHAGDGERAAVLVRAAAATADEYGMAGVATRAERVAAAISV